MANGYGNDKKNMYDKFILNLEFSQILKSFQIINKRFVTWCPEGVKMFPNKCLRNVCQTPEENPIARVIKI